MRVSPYFLIVLLAGILAGGCDEESHPLAPYAGERPLLLQKVTVSATPDIQWVGGQVAAVGINRGSQAALDNTLVWLVTADENTISSVITVGPDGSDDQVVQVGGTPLDVLEDNTEYTFWIAEKDVLDGSLSQQSGLGFADTTFTLNYQLRGRTSGDDDFVEDIQIVRDQRLTSDAYVVTWTPGDVGVRQLAIRANSTGGFTDLIWHVVADNDNAQGILPPVTIGETPAGAQEAVAWAGGFEPAPHTLWMTGTDWNGSFSPSADDYAFFQIFPTNF